MNISFGSNYSVDIKKNFPFQVIGEIELKDLKNIDVKTDFTSFEEIQKTGIYGHIQIAAIDHYDGDIEKILTAYGIPFKKESISNALNLENIVKRINLYKLDQMQNCKLVRINTKKLDELFKKDKLAYIEPEGKNGIRNRYKLFGEYLKTGRNINATRVVLSEHCDGLQATVVDGRHRFAYMRDIGIEAMPIALDEDSIKLAEKYNLIV